jgi:hypothetical protein
MTSSCQASLTTRAGHAVDPGWWRWTATQNALTGRACAPGSTTALRSNCAYGRHSNADCWRRSSTSGSAMRPTPADYAGSAGPDTTQRSSRNSNTGNDARTRIVLNALADKVADMRRIRALGFCVSIDHAECGRRLRRGGAHLSALSRRRTYSAWHGRLHDRSGRVATRGFAAGAGRGPAARGSGLWHRVGPDVADYFNGHSSLIIVVG